MPLLPLCERGKKLSARYRPPSRRRPSPEMRRSGRSPTLRRQRPATTTLIRERQIRASPEDLPEVVYQFTESSWNYLSNCQTGFDATLRCGLRSAPAWHRARRDRSVSTDRRPCRPQDIPPSAPFKAWAVKATMGIRFAPCPEQCGGRGIAHNLALKIGDARRPAIGASSLHEPLVSSLGLVAADEDIVQTNGQIFPAAGHLLKRLR